MALTLINRNRNLKTKLPNTCEYKRMDCIGLNYEEALKKIKLIFSVVIRNCKTISNVLISFFALSAIVGFISCDSYS